jgi:DNA-binding transcriptional MerR regulator
MESLEQQQQDILAKSMRKKGITPRKMKKILKEFNKKNQESASKVLEISMQVQELMTKNEALEAEIKELRKNQAKKEGPKKKKETAKKEASKPQATPNLQEQPA